jgi:hypothetical protein
MFLPLFLVGIGPERPPYWGGWAVSPTPTVGSIMT